MGPYIIESESGSMDYPQALGEREWVAMIEENTGPENSRIDAIRRRCVEAGYPEAE